MDKRKERLDAGLASLDHYELRLPPWRHQIRQLFLPIVRWETPYVALLQQTMRTPVLDTYFAWTANLGTHTAFMVVLPMLFWCGYVEMGRAMVHILAAGVFLSGFAKDFLCLPRPLSPPLQRITMSGSAALEYGFPSTHSTNAVSVVYYALHVLRTEDPNLSSTSSKGIQVALYIYATSIILGRLYCGMHGFFDVITGSILGALIGAAQCRWGVPFDDWLYSSSAKGLIMLVVLILILVRIHPEPADDCPCFDDSVAFAAVMIGCEAASWHFARSVYTASTTGRSVVPFSLEKIGWPMASLRIVMGILAVFAWRGLMKPVLLRILPPLFRVIEKSGLDLPRRFFMPASQYSTVPKQRMEDNVIPSARDIPHLLSNLKRNRAISVGPQSQADALETLAVREKQRRDSITKANLKVPGAKDGYFAQPDTAIKASGRHSRKRSSSLDQFRAQMGLGADMLSPTAVFTPMPEDELSPADQERNYLQQKEMFANLLKPRVRYDVEVVTKLIVYVGIAVIAIEVNPVLFARLGMAG